MGLVNRSQLDDDLRQLRRTSGVYQEYKHYHDLAQTIHYIRTRTLRMAPKPPEGMSVMYGMAMQDQLRRTLRGQIESVQELYHRQSDELTFAEFDDETFSDILQRVGEYAAYGNYRLYDQKRDLSEQLEPLEQAAATYRDHMLEQLQRSTDFSRIQELRSTRNLWTLYGSIGIVLSALLALMGWTQRTWWLLRAKTSAGPKQGQGPPASGTGSDPGSGSTASGRDVRRHSGGAWFADPRYMRWVAPWFEPLLAYGVVGMLGIPAGYEVLQPAAAALLHWLPHYRRRGGERRAALGAR